MILGREGYIDLACLADVLANQLLLKSLDEGVGTDGQRIIKSLATFKGLAVNIALEIDGGLVAVLYRTIGDIHQSGCSLAGCLQLLLHILVGNGSVSLLHLNALVLAQGNFRLNGNFCSVDKALALLHLFYFDLRAGNDVLTALFHSLRIGIINAGIGSVLIEQACAVHLLDNLERSLALPESRYVESSFILIIGFLDRLVKVLSRHFHRQFDHVLLF